jgi:hypothetical protein
MSSTHANCTRINLYAGPGVGKSTTAARLFSELKILWNKPTDPQVELVMEYIKEWAWLKIAPASWDQFYVFAKQVRREDIVLRHKHTHVITDSPIFMQLAYLERGNAAYAPMCCNSALLFESQYPSLHILLKRTVPYQGEGRYENYDQACQMDKIIRNTLLRFRVPFVELDPVTEFNQIKELAIRHIREEF